MSAGPRGREIYVSGKTKERLFLILELEKQNLPVGLKDLKTGKVEWKTPHNIPTVDEIADRLLNEKIEQDFPNMKDLEKRFAALRGQFISELRSPTVEKPMPNPQNGNDRE